MDDFRPTAQRGARLWSWVVAVLGLLLCVVLLNRLEDRSLQRAADAELWLDQDLQHRLDAALTSTSECADQPTCHSSPVEGSLSSEWRLELSRELLPELVPYLELSRSWNNQVSATLDADGVVVDRPGLKSLVEGTMPEGLRAELRAALDRLQATRDDADQMARLADWGWKLALVLTALCCAIGLWRHLTFLRRPDSDWGNHGRGIPGSLPRV
ncbi:MAG TPA: hypothetical protein PLV13_10110 [Ilumatobacteraceae bacterium]|nr:hypothetical protein [Ilumatobacteraceae bacterium]